VTSVSGVRIAALISLCLGFTRAHAEEPVWAEARAALYAQYFQQALIPGTPGSVTRVEPAFPLSLSGFVRFGAVDLPGAPDSVSGELSLWGRLGPLDGIQGDGDVTAAWAQYRRGPWRVRLGRQLTLPGSRRYVRFDGATLGATAGPLDVDVYGGWVALPRWNQARGASLLGFVGDGLRDPLLLEAQNRAGQVTFGGRVALRLPADTRLGFSFHQQHDLVGVAARVVAADLALQPLSWLGGGARATFDLQALDVSEAAVWLDVRKLAAVPLAIDYSYQKPSLLLPSTSVLAAFGGSSWHELGAETTVRALQSLHVTGRGAVQLFEGDRPGGRAHLQFRWWPGLERRLLVLAEVARVLVPPSGYVQLRAGARFRATETISTSLDAALFLYDTPVRGVDSSMTGVASLEWAARPWLRVLVSSTVMRTPYAAFEAQGLARLVVESP
jgi:hypothetical protein